VEATGTAAGRETRRRIVDAALETLRADGVAGATARRIGRAGGLNQALVFYHFGSVAGALLAAADDLTGRRLPAYRAAVDGAAGGADLAAAVGRLVAEDLADGHVAAMAALVAGSDRSPALRDGLAERLEPWVGLAETVAARLAPDRPAADVAVGSVAAVLGLGLLARLGDDGGRGRVADVAGVAARLLAATRPG
jgi:AcrR family transcriptional regulator